MLNLRRSNYKAFKKLNIRERIATLHDNMGAWLLSLMTPTQITELFPRYYMKALPDIGGFKRAMPTSMSTAKAKEVEEQLGKTATGSAGGRNMEEGGWKKRWQEGMNRAITSRKDVIPPPQLSPEQKQTWEELKKGPIESNDPRMKMFGRMNEQQLKDAGITKEKQDNGKEVYKYTAPTVSDEEVQNYIKNNGDNGGKRSGGSRSWRNRNPGNIEYGNFAKSMGAIGSDGRFAIFKTEEDGVKAQRELLFNSKNYRNLTLAQAIARWAPASENNVPAYIKAMGANPNQKMSEFTKEQQDILLQNMRRHEGWTPGKTDSITADYSEKNMQLAREKLISEKEASRIKDLSKYTASEPMVGNPPPSIVGDLPEVGDVSKTGFNRFSKAKIDPQQEAGNIVQVTTPFGEINVHKTSAMAYKGYFDDLAKAGAPISKLGSLNVRQKRFGAGWSEHSYGNAVDIDDMLGWSPKMQKWLQENPGVLDSIGNKWGMKRQDYLGKNYDPNHVEFGGVVTKEAREQLEKQIEEGKLQLNAPNTNSSNNGDNLPKLEGTTNSPSTGSTEMVPAPKVAVDQTNPLPSPDIIGPSQAQAVPNVNAPNNLSPSQPQAAPNVNAAPQAAVTPQVSQPTNLGTRYIFNKEAFLDEVGRKTMAYAPIVGPGRDYVWNKTREGLISAEKAGVLKYNERTGELIIKDMNHPKIQEILNDMKNNNLDRNVFLQQKKEEIKQAPPTPPKVENVESNKALPPEPPQPGKTDERNAISPTQTVVPHQENKNLGPVSQQTPTPKVNEKVKVDQEPAKVKTEAHSAPKTDEKPKVDIPAAAPNKTETKESAPAPAPTVTPAPAPKIEAPAPKKTPTEVKTNASGGINKINSGEISGYPLSESNKDNMVVVNKQQKPLFTMNTNEKVMMDPQSRTASVMPAGRNSSLKPPSNPMSGIMNSFQNTLETMQQTNNETGGNKPADQTRTTFMPERENKNSGLALEELNARSKEWYHSPSMQRATYRAGGAETGEPNSGFHFSQGNRS